MSKLVSPKKTNRSVEAVAETDESFDRMSMSVRKLAQDGKLDHVYKIPLVELNCQFGIVRNRTEDLVPLQTAVKRERSRQKSKVTVVFAVRRPGWPSCREHGQQLAELVAEEPSAALLATVKETGADDKALLDFYEKYFARHAIYKDEKWNLYRAMGGRSVRIGQVVKGLFSSFRRYKEKKIEASRNITAGDGWMQGGVLIFDKGGNLKHVIEEIFGEPLDVQGIKQVIEQIKNKQSLNTDDSSSQYAEDSSESIHEVSP